ncbi:hypothetical protein BD779DRAFT_351590 [Infundibulicybe gibba]|nr:hypothetical protein BD779DRAFT_351590 [Infundibulicybe gibba]
MEHPQVTRRYTCTQRDGASMGHTTRQRARMQRDRPFAHNKTARPHPMKQYIRCNKTASTLAYERCSCLYTMTRPLIRQAGTPHQRRQVIGYGYMYVFRADPTQAHPGHGSASIPTTGWRPNSLMTRLLTARMHRVMLRPAPGISRRTCAP